jgi:phosphatidylglycerophosphatase A
MSERDEIRSFDPTARTIDGNPRRMIRWDRIEGAQQWAVVAVATGLGSGLLPRAPGTCGTVVGLLAALVVNPWGPGGRFLFWAALTGVGVWAAGKFDQLMGSRDNQNIVIDEVVGFGIAAFTAGRDPGCLAVAFVLFRAFDILKPGPVRLLDAWSKKRRDGTGLGVMLDDVAAGFLALACVVLLQRIGILAWP